MPCRRRLIFFTTPVVWMGACSIAPAAVDATLDRLCANTRAVVLSTPSAMCNGLRGSAANDLQTMRPDGSWSDIDFADADPAHWDAARHLLRLERIARAYYRQHQGPRDTPRRLAAGLTYWLDRDPKNPNWWFNEIDVPRELGCVLCMLGPDAPAAVRERGVTLMKRADWGRQTGANLTDETWIQLLRGCIEPSEPVVTQALDRTWQELRTVGPDAEGIQADGSFHQHGPLFYNSGYGTVMIECALRFLAAAKGTPLGPPAEASQALNRMVVDGDLWMFRGKAWDFGACGRSICRPGSTGDGPVKRLLEKLAADPIADPSLAGQLAGGGPVGNRQFWCSDYMTQRRPTYFASVRMYSDRTANTDALTNGENRKSHHIADGATCLMRRGDEYFDIYPAWDWLRIPGTTIEQDTPLPPKKIKRIGATAFAGGVSDGKNGCAAMELQYNALRANKAWFCFDHAIVCLGAGIDCDTDHSVLTTLNQCKLTGEVILDGKDMTTPADQQFDGPHWLWHDGIGYVVPAGQQLQARVGPQSGAWSDIGVGPSATITQDVFNVVLDHGPRVRDGRYEYVLLPDATREQTAAAAGHLPIEVLANTPSLQAVREPSTGLLQVVFHKAGELNAGTLRVSADAPCLLMVRPALDRTTVSIANPLNAAGTVHVRSSFKGFENVALELPGGLMAGSTVTYDSALARK